MRKFLRVPMAVAVLLFCSYAEAGVTPLALAIIPPVQFPPSDFAIVGGRASVIWGKHRSVYGLDVGVIGNITDQNFVGIGISGIFNRTHGMTTVIGLQAAGITNMNIQKTTIVGVQATLGVNYNTAESSVVGFQIAPIANLSAHTKVMGAQIGIYNTARDVYGFQIGLVNVAQALHGIQIGLVNFNKTGLINVAPFINIGF